MIIKQGKPIAIKKRRARGNQQKPAEYIAQQRVFAPLLAEAAAVLGFRAILGTKLGLKLDILGLE